MPVDEVNSVAGFIRPGNHIDVFVNIAYKLSGFDASFATSIEDLPSEIRDKIPPSLVDAARSFDADEEGGNSIADLFSSVAPADVIIPVLQDVRVLATGPRSVRGASRQAASTAAASRS